MHKVSAAQAAYLNSLKRHRQKVMFFRLLIFIAFILLWEGAARTGLVNDFIFSSPVRMFQTFLSMTKDGSIFYHTGITLAETLVSVLCVLAATLVLAMVLWWNQTLYEILEPYLVVLNSLPKSAMAPVLIVWLGNTPKTIIVTGILIAVFGSVMSLTVNFREADPEQIKLIYTLKGGKLDVLRKVLIPRSIPTFISLMKVNVGLCLVGVIIGEFLAANEGLGYLIIYGSQVFKMDWVMMSIVILCLLAAGLYALINAIERRCLRKW